MPEPGVAVISVHYYYKYLDVSLAAATKLASKAGAQTIVFVANKPELFSRIEKHAARIRGRSVFVRQHDNSGMEFGAYQAGLDELDGADFGWVLFANDTFTVHQSFSTVYRRHLVDTVKRSRPEAPMAVGQIESLPTAFSMHGFETSQWLSTNIFALNKPALGVLAGRVYCPEVNLLITPSPRQEAFFSSELDPTLVRHMSEWLFGQHSGNSWYGAEPLNETNAERFAGKARSILQEKLLAARLAGAGTLFRELRESNRLEELVNRVERRIYRSRWSRSAALRQDA